MQVRDKTDYIVIHCSATPPNWNGGAREIDVDHRARGFSQIGYHYVIRRSGVIEAGRPQKNVGAHVQGYNYNSVGVCLVGGVDNTNKPDNNFTPAQFTSLCKALQKLTEDYPNAKVLGHRDLSPDKDGDGVIEPHEWLKACPCFDAGAWWQQLRS